jgi:2-isopropylmalate synthase
VYDAEHFFDGYLDDPAYALLCLRAAAEAGAETVVCCDTNGGTLPTVIGRVMNEVVAALGASGARVGIHCHDDAGCGVACTLAAVEQGAAHVQGTINGYGERCGNANLVTIIADLQLKLGYDCLRADQLAELTPTAHFLDELLNFAPDPDQPYVGRNAFAHKGGMHVAGVNVDPATFEHVDPVVVGNHRELLVSELSGRGTVQARAQDAGISLDSDQVERVLESVKEREHRGYHYEAADGSLELLMRRETGEYEPLFVLESWRVIVEQTSSAGHVDAEATVKVWIGDKRYYKTAEGNGPVNALDKALRAALEQVYPGVTEPELVNFKVRILDEAHGSAAQTRVLIDVVHDHEPRGFIGVSGNVIEASWEALVESLEYGLQPGRRVARAPREREAAPARAPLR